MNDIQQHHYFASCAFGWATADTQEDAVQKLAIEFYSSQKVRKAQMAGQPGSYVWCCKVHKPQDSSYQINNFAPQGVEVSDCCNMHITYMGSKRSSVVYWEEPRSAS